MSGLPRCPKNGPPDVMSELDPWLVELASAWRDWDGHQISSVPKMLRLPPLPTLPGWPRGAWLMNGFLSYFPHCRDGQYLCEVKSTLGISRGLSLDLGLHNLISLTRYQMTFAELESRVKRGDRDASRKIVNVMDVCNRWLYGQTPRNGFRFKTHLRHNLLMLFGLAGGLQELTSTGLVHFFDQACSCGEIHSQRVLLRLRGKLTAALVASKAL
jgi:hypothetical protein